MDFEPVISKDLAEVGYDPTTSTLGVRFLKGGEYHYSGVPEQVWQELMNAPSKGQYFNLCVKKAGYPYVRVA